MAVSESNPFIYRGIKQGVCQKPPKDAAMACVRVLADAGEASARNRSINGAESGAGRKTGPRICAGPLLFVSLQRIVLRT